MNSPTLTFAFILFTLVSLGLLIATVVSFMKEEDKDGSIVICHIVAFCFFSLSLVATGKEAKLLIENPNLCWKCGTLNIDYLVNDEKKDVVKMLPEHTILFYKAMNFLNSDLSVETKSCLYFTLTGKKYGFFNIILETSLTREEAEDAVNLCLMAD